MKIILIILLTFVCLFIPFKTTHAEGEILFSDNFSDGNLDGWVIEGGNWFINNGNLAGSKSGKNFGGRVNNGPSEWDNYILELDFNSQQGIDEGVGFRYTQGGNGYELNLRHGTGIYNTPEIILRKGQDGIISVVSDTHSFPLINNKWYHLKVEVNGENIKVWVDGTLIFDLTDAGTKVKKGTITLSYWTGEIGVVFSRFDNIKVVKLAPSTPPKTPLILIPGIGGSELKSDQTFISGIKDCGTFPTFTYNANDIVWVNTTVAGISPCDDYFDVLKLKADGQTSEYSQIILNGTFLQGSYGSLIKFFTDNDYELNKTLFLFPYDWRKDISLTKLLLDQKIEQIKTQTGSTKVDIVAHSMGGLVARNYIADSQKAQNVRKLFTLGTPHLGAVKFLRALIYGDCLTIHILQNLPICLGLNNSEVKDILQNMIGGFELIPSQAYFNFYSGDNNQYPYPYRTESGALNYTQIKNLLTDLGYNIPLFNPSETFHTLDSTLSNTNGVDVTIIAGSGVDTLGQIIEKKTTSLLGIQSTHKDIQIINGDKAVPLFSASLNDLNKSHSLLGSAKVYYTKQEHGDLVSSGPALQLVKNILNGDNTLLEGVSLEPYKLRGFSLSVHSPINIHVYDSSGNHTGPTSDGNFEANIPGSSYDSLDDAKFIFLPEDGVYTIKFEATDQGSFDFKIRKFEDDVNSQTLLYRNIPITSSSVGETNFDTNSKEPPTLTIDQQPITPNAILLGDANYDQTPPTILANFPVDGQIYLLNQNVQVDYSCTDEVSGLDLCIGSAPNGSNLDTSSVGTKTFMIVADDKAGNNSSKTITYKVQYSGSGTCLGNLTHMILQPINSDGTGVFKQGNTIPTKFRVCDSNGLSISSSDTIKSFSLIKTISGTVVSNVNEVVNSTTPESNFRWDTTNQQWIFNMSTKNLSAGKTYFYKIGLNDETSIEFSFGLR